MVKHIHNLLTRWRLALVVSLTVPFALFASYAAIELHNAQREDLVAEINRAALVTANVVNQQLGTSVGYLKALATSDAALRDDVPALYAHAQRVMQSMPEATAISLVGTGDELIFLTLRPLGTRGLPVGDRSAVQQVFATGLPAVSGPFKSPIADRFVTSVAVPVFREGKVIYCLRMILRTSALNDLLTSQKMPPDWTLAIIDNNGAIVARSRKPEMYVGKQVPAAVLDAVRSKNGQLVDLPTIEGTAAKAVFLQLPGWGWNIAVGAPAEYFEQRLSRLTQLLALLGVALAAMGAIVVAGLSSPRPSARAAVPAVAPMPLVLKGSWPAIVALLLVVGMGVLLALSTQSGLTRLQERADQRFKATQQQAQLADLLSDFQDLETGQRGYVMTGREEFLEPYTAASTAIPQAITALKETLRSVPLGAFQWRDLDEAVSTRQLLAARAVAERRALGDKVLDDVALFSDGKLAMDKLRLRVATLDNLLGQRMDVLHDELLAERERMRQSLWLTSLAAWLLVVFAIGFWMRERHRRGELFAELAESHAELEQRVQARTAALQIANARVRNFASESARQVELERTRLSREVHDQIGQIFTGIKMILRTLQPGSLAPEQQQALTQALDMGVQTTRRIAAELRPPLLDDLGLPQALAHYLQTCFAPLGITYTLDMPDAHGLNDQQMTQLFRVVQEACTNICRHAHASHVELTSHTTDQGLVLYMDDDGTGFDAEQVRDGALGLVGMRERVHSMGGTVEITRRTTGGTRLAVHLPAIRNGPTQGGATV